MTTATTGTGTITLGSAVSGYLTFALAGVQDGDVIDYAIKDGSNSEIGTGTYTSSGTTLTRSVTKSTNSNAAISLSGTAEVFISPRAETLNIEANRQNSFLLAIYQSKLFSEYRRLVNCFATGFKGASDALNGILTGSSSNYTVVSASGYVGPSSAGTSVQINPNSTTAAAQGYTFIDRTTAVTNSQTVLSIGVFSNTARTIKAKIVKRNSANNYDVVVDQSFAHAGGGWQDVTLTSPYVVPGSGTYYLGAYTTGGANPNTTAHVARSYVNSDLTGTGVATTAEDTNGAFPTRYSYQSGVNNMTIVTVAQTSDSSVSNGRVLIEYDHATASPTLNTDLTAEVTCDGGANWTLATLTAVTSYSGASTQRRVAETADTACTAGTDFRARIKTANNKNVPVYGVAAQVVG